MNLKQNKYILSFTFFILFLSFFSSVNSQTDATRKYDELIGAPPVQATPQQVIPTPQPLPSVQPSPVQTPDVQPLQTPNVIETQPSLEVSPVQTPQSVVDSTPITPSALQAEQPVQPPVADLSNLLPKLNEQLYKDWSILPEQEKWNTGATTPTFVVVMPEVLSELGLRNLLKSTFSKGESRVEIVIYEFNDFAGAYSAFTLLHKGDYSKLKIGKGASETESSFNFWKGNYYIDVTSTGNLNDDAKQFIKIASQEVSENIKTEQLPPVVAIQMPSLNRLPGTEKYCPGATSCKAFLSAEFADLDFDLLGLKQSGGLIAAKYNFPEYPKDQIKLVLIRYTMKDISVQTFNALKEKHQNKKSENKDMEIDFDNVETLLRIKNKKDDFTLLKQKGNLLGIVFGATNKKSGEKVLDLIPWPIEIVK